MVGLFEAQNTRIFWLALALGRKFAKQIELQIVVFRRIFNFFNNFVGQGSELEFLEDFLELLLVGRGHLHFFQIERYGHVGPYGRQEPAHPYVVDGTFNFLSQLAFDLVGMCEHVVDTPKLCDEFRGSLLAHSRTSGEVVGRVAHKRQQVDDLCGGRYTILLRHLAFAQRVVTATMTGSVDIDIVPHELSVVLVGGEHIGLDAHASGSGGKGAYHIVGLEAVGLEHGYMVSLENVLDDGHARPDILGRLLALCLVGGKSLVTEGLAVVESHSHVCGLLLGYHLVEGIDEPHYSRCIESLGVDAWVFEECVVRPIYKRIGVQ